jgi:Bacterial Ig domain/Fibronectin type III domain
VRFSRVLLIFLVASLLLGMGLLLPLLPRSAAATAIGYRDFSYRDANAVQTPTDDKPQSKLWFQDGSWWGLLYSTSQHATCIYRLDLSSQQWINTGTIVDTRPTARGDALWDSQTGKLYVVSGTTVVSEYGSPPDPAAVSAGSTQLLRFSYDAASKTYSLDPGFPATVHQGSTESITIAKDSTGELWVTYTLVAPDNTSQVYVTHSAGDDTTWATPYVLPTTAASAHYDDISAIIAFQGNKIGVMWSNQLTRKFYFAVHQDGAPDSSWQTEVAYGGGVGGCSTGCANDHINLKTVQDGSGRVFAAIKTANRNTGQPFVVLIVRDSKGSWSSYPFGAVEDVHTRPMVMIDEEHREIFMFAVSPEVGGTIYYKKSPLDNISFAPGLGTPFMQSDVDTDISNPTSTKQNLNSQTGLVILASANTHGYYWHNYMSLSGEPAPPPAAPTNLAVSSPTTNADSTAQLSWSDNSTNEDGFAIERKTGTNAYAQVATAPSNATSYTDTGLTAATTYTYRVRAWNSAGNSLYSDEASVTTAQVGPTRAFTPTADAYVDGGVPNTNYGTKTNLSVDASPVQESYLKFQLTGLTGNTITSAKLRLYVSDNGSVKGGSVAKMSNTSWTETGVTYNNRPAIDGATLSTLGAVNIGSGYEFNVTPAVTGDGTISLGLKTSSSDGVHYSSREDTTHAPQLVVTVTPGDTTPPETTIDSGPSGTVASSSASFTFSSSESVLTFECSLDGAPFASCTSPKSYAGLTQGSHAFQVRATDGSGNTDPTPASRSWTVDTVPPAANITSSPPDPSNSSSASFSFMSDDPNATYQCSLDNSAWAACTSPKAYTGLADGAHTFSVRGTDALGNVDPAPPAFTWTIDTVPPDTTITAGPQGTATSDSATFTFTSTETPSTFECSLDSAPFAACTSPASYSGLANGDHTFSVRATDAAGNTDATPTARSWTVNVAIADTTPPTVSLTSPADGSSVHGKLVLSADASDDVAVDHVDFLVNGTVVGTAGSAPYTVSWDSTTTSDGSVTIAARAVDTSGNATTSDGRTVTVDNTPPDTNIDSGPSGAVSATTASFAFSSNESATFECSLDGSAFSSCTSPNSYDALADGTHTFQVRAADSTGNVDATPATRSWTVDTGPPDTSITGGPAGTVNSRSATFSFTATENNVTFACSVDGSAFAGCSSPATYTGMSDGAHTFQVRATDGAGNVDATPASRTWAVDPVLFSDGFESGDLSRWTQVRVTGSGAVANAQSSVVKTGSYSAYITAPTTSNYAYARAALAASQTDLTVSGDFDITVEGASGQEVPIVKLYDASGSRLVYVYRRNISGTIYVVYNGTTYYTATKMALGTWTNFAVHTITAGAASTVEVTMNGKSIYRTTTASLGTSGIRTIQIGNDKQLPFALYADNIQARI